MSRCVHVSTPKIALFAIPAARLEAAIEAQRIDPFQIMLNSRDLPVESFGDDAH
jgi:hypothetical protein